MNSTVRIAKLKKLDSRMKAANIRTLDWSTCSSARSNTDCGASGKASNLGAEDGSEDCIVAGRVFRLEAETTRSRRVAVEAEAGLRRLRQLAVRAVLTGRTYRVA